LTTGQRWESAACALLETSSPVLLVPNEFAGCYYFFYRVSNLALHFASPASASRKSANDLERLMILTSLEIDMHFLYKSDGDPLITQDKCAL
jgi:hypothetical protein